MNCPRCDVALENKTISGYNNTMDIAQCSQCEGTWLDKGKIDPIQRVIEPVFWEKRTIPSKDEQYKNLSCPSCTEERSMEKIPHPRDKNVILDQCVNCSGIWLDGGEIRAIQQENWFLILGRLLP